MLAVDEAQNVEVLPLKPHFLPLQVLIQLLLVLFDHFTSTVNLLQHQLGELCLRFCQHPHLLEVALQLTLRLLVRRREQLRDFRGSAALQNPLNARRVKRLHHVAVERQAQVDVLNLADVVLNRR